MSDNKKKKRTVKKPSWFVWYILGPIILLYYRCHIKFKKNKIKLRGCSFLIGPHRTYMDFLTMPKAVYPQRGHFVATTYWFRRPLLNWFFTEMGVIPKDQYKADIRAIAKMAEVLKNDEIIFIYPEGQMSYDGRALPLAPGFDKLVKKYKANVYFMNPNGSYLCKPKWAKKFSRGTIDCNIELLIKSEDLDSMTNEEIMTKINNAMNQNYDFDWMKENPNIKFRNNKIAEGIENVIIKCPECGNEYSIEGKKNHITCSCCSFDLKFKKNSYFFEENKYYSNLGEFFDYDHNELVSKINNGYIVEDEVKLSAIENLEEIDKGNYSITMDKESIVIKNSEEELKFEISKIINLVITLGVAFEIPTPEKTYRVYPKDGKHAIIFKKYFDIIKEN